MVQRGSMTSSKGSGSCWKNAPMSKRKLRSVTERAKTAQGSQNRGKQESGQVRIGTARIGTARIGTARIGTARIGPPGRGIPQSREAFAWRLRRKRQSRSRRQGSGVRTLWLYTSYASQSQRQAVLAFCGFEVGISLTRDQPAVVHGPSQSHPQRTYRIIRGASVARKASRRQSNNP